MESSSSKGSEEVSFRNGSSMQKEDTQKAINSEFARFWLDILRNRNKLLRNKLIFCWNILYFHNWMLLSKKKKKVLFIFSTNNYFLWEVTKILLKEIWQCCTTWMFLWAFPILRIWFNIIWIGKDVSIISAYIVINIYIERDHRIYI